MEAVEWASAATQGSIGAELSHLAEQLRRSTVHVDSGRQGSGSGVIWRADGLIVTNAHVARGPSASVELWDGRALPATVTGRDDRRDLAALQVEAGDLPAATVGDSRALRVGQLVFAMGNPLGVRSALTMGVVHAIGPSDGRFGSWVQADVRLLPGNSGGPLVDASGRVMGINSMVSGGLGLAVPSTAVVSFLRGITARPQLGIVSQPIDVPVGDGRWGTPGLLVLEVLDGSPAERAGLLVGDIVVGANGRRFGDLHDLLNVLAAGMPVIRLETIHGGVTLTREVRLAPTEGSAGAAA